MKMTRKVKSIVITAVASTTVITTAIAAMVASNATREASDNPWDYTMYTFGENNSLKSATNDLIVQGDIRTNGSMNFGGENASVSGYVISGGSIDDELKSFSFEDKFENAKTIPHINVFNNIYEIVSGDDSVTYHNEDISEYFIRFDSPVIAESAWNINVSSEIPPSDTEEVQESGNKFGAFGAGFLASVYENPSKWSSVLPVFYPETVLNRDESGLKDLIELGENSNFIPVGEQSASEGWKNYESLPGTVFQDSFNKSYISEHIKQLKDENKSVFSVGETDSVRIEAGYDNSMINPSVALDAKSITITGGSLVLQGDYENLEEIKLDNWGGIQLIGSFPKLKRIYKTSYGNLNLAGDFSSLECIYMNGGQLLLGNGNKGFKSNNTSFINENGHIIIYTAKDVTLTNSTLITNQNITIRGAGKNASLSKFNAENSLFAANNGLCFEDMNDNNSKRYNNLPVFYSNVPMSFVNCNMELLQGAFISTNGALIFTESNIEVCRGFLFSPLGINEYALNSSVGLYIDTWSYNIDPNINSLNMQQNGIWKLGSIEEMEMADFPKELASNIGNVESFINEIQKVKNSNGEKEDKYGLGEEGHKPGAIILNSHLLSDADIQIDADYLFGGENGKSVIASRNGNITLNINSEIDFNGIIYAPNGKVTINGSGKINGRIFAQEIEIISDSFVITNDGEDISYLGFTNQIKPDPFDSEASSDVSSDTDTSSDSSSTSTESTPTTSVPEGDSSIPVESSSSKPESSSSGTDSTSSDTSTTDSESSMSEYNQAEYEYDNLGRLTKVIYDSDNYIEYTYDANGNITNVKTVENGEVQ